MDTGEVGIEEAEDTEVEAEDTGVEEDTMGEEKGEEGRVEDTGREIESRAEGGTGNAEIIVRI